MQYHVGGPMERVGLDIVGPFPVSNHGNKYILVVTDYFTRWVESYPMSNAETTTIVDLFITYFYYVGLGFPDKYTLTKGDNLSLDFSKNYVQNSLLIRPEQ